MCLHNPQNCPKMGKIPCFLPDKQGTLSTRSKMHPQSLLRARPFEKTPFARCLFCCPCAQLRRIFIPSPSNILRSCSVIARSILYLLISYTHKCFIAAFVFYSYKNLTFITILYYKYIIILPFLFVFPFKKMFPPLCSIYLPKEFL